MSEYKRLRNTWQNLWCQQDGALSHHAFEDQSIRKPAEWSPRVPDRNPMSFLP